MIEWYCLVCSNINVSKDCPRCKVMKEYGTGHFLQLLHSAFKTATSSSSPPTALPTLASSSLPSSLPSSSESNCDSEQQLSAAVEPEAAMDMEPTTEVMDVEQPTEVMIEPTTVQQTKKASDADPIDLTSSRPTTSSSSTSTADGMSPPVVIQCGRCHTQFKNRKYLQNHLNKGVCTKNKTGGLTENQVEHALNVALPDKFNCKLCSSKYKFESGLSKHMKKKHREAEEDDDDITVVVPKITISVKSNENQESLVAFKPTCKINTLMEKMRKTWGKKGLFYYKDTLLIGSQTFLDINIQENDQIFVKLIDEDEEDEEPARKKSKTIELEDD